MTKKRLDDLLARMPPRLARKYREIVQRVRSKWVLAELEKAMRS